MEKIEIYKNYTKIGRQSLKRKNTRRIQSFSHHRKWFRSLLERLENEKKFKIGKEKTHTNLKNKPSCTCPNTWYFGLTRCWTVDNSSTHPARTPWTWEMMKITHFYICWHWRATYLYSIDLHVPKAVSGLLIYRHLLEFGSIFPSMLHLQYIWKKKHLEKNLLLEVGFHVLL